jgi:hypothetical protein
MIFGRSFETALAAYFAREDSTAAFFREWRKYQDGSLAYAKCFSRINSDARTNMLGRHSSDQSAEGRIGVRPKPPILINWDRSSRHAASLSTTTALTATRT